MDNDQSSQDSTTWLDEFPTEICERIFRHFLIEWDPSTEICRNTVALANTSKKQKTAAVQALVVPTTIAYNTTFHKPSHGFQHLLSQNLRSLHLFRPISADEEALFRGPALQYAAMTVDSDALNVLAGCGVKSLRLFVEYEVTWEELINCLQTLKLIHLTLEFSSAGISENCPCVPVAGSSSSVNTRLDTLLTTLPNLHSLNIRCDAHRRDYAEQVIQRVLQHPTIKHVNIVTLPPLQLLQALRSVTIDSFTHNQFETAMQLSNILTHFFTERCLNTEQLTQLKRCNRLKLLSISLEEGAEAAIGDVVQALPNLQALKLEWTMNITEDEEGIRRRSFYAAFPGAIQRAVEKGKKLVELRICNATVDAVELDEILKTLGKRLVVFGVTISYPDIGGFLCLQRCLDGIMKYNPRVKKLDVEWQGFNMLDPHHVTRKHQGVIRRVLRTARCLYVRNCLVRLPYFLVALNGLYRLRYLSYDYCGVYDDSDDGGDDVMEIEN